MTDVKKSGGGLLPLPRDNRDFKFGAVFPMPKIDELPLEFRTSEPLQIKNQWTSDLCTAYGSAAVSEDQERVLLSPEYIFAKTKQITGEWQSWGADLRSACKALQTFGSLEQKDAILSLEVHGRDKVANWENWPKELDTKAKEHKKQSYFSITGTYDLFDNIRGALWIQRDEKRSVFTGVLWRDGWLFSNGGIIPKEYPKTGFGHAFKIFGWKQIKNEPYLIAQLSNGTEYGDGGIFYFPRKVVNEEFTYGAFMFVDIDPELIKQQQLTIIQIILLKIQQWIQLLQAKSPQIAPPITEVIPNTPFIVETPPTPEKPPETMQEMVKRVCKEEGLSAQMQIRLYATINCESRFNPLAVHKNTDGSLDIGIAQFNTRYWIGKGKLFPDIEYVKANPERCIRETAKLFKQGKAHYWVCYKRLFPK